MSLILEALRKSEAERRRGNTPDVAMELPPAALRVRPATPAWVWPGFFAALVVVALVWWLAGRRDVHEPTAATSPATVAAPIDTTPQAPAVVPRTPVAPPVKTTPSEVASAPTLQASRPDNAATRVAPRAQASTPAQTPVRDIPPAQAPTTLPPAPVPVTTATSMTGVKLSMHMWDAAADKRFVILNGQRMGEGDRNGDVQVIAIQRDGVVVERDGQRARVALP